MKHSNYIQIALADDHTMVRNGLKSLLEATGHYKVSVEAESGLELFNKLKAAKSLPDICIIDLQMKPLNGYETILLIKKKWPQLKIIVLSQHEHELLISKLLHAGAGSYLAKTTSVTTLIEAISSVLKKEVYYTDTVTQILLKQSKNKTDTLAITDKELQFLCLCCSDLTQKEIAQKMNVQTRTVDNYRDSLFNKLNKHSRTGLAVYTTTTGLINLSVEYLLSSGLLDSI